MKIAERIAELKSDQHFLAIRPTIDKLGANTALVTLDYWKKRTKGNKKNAELFTERYVVSDYELSTEGIWLDDVSASESWTRSKQW